MEETILLTDNNQPANKDPKTAGLVGYTIVAHQDPLQVVRLVNRLTAHPSTGGVVLHWDRSSEPPNIKFANPDRVAWVTKPANVRWGRWSQVVAHMKALEVLCEKFSTIEWIIGLSGQDYPVMSLAEIARRLARSHVDAFVESSPVHERFPGNAEWRYNYRYFRIPGWVPFRVGRLGVRVVARTSSLVSGIWWLPKRQGSYIGFRRLHVDISDWLGGSDWVMVNRSAADVLRFKFADSEVRRRFRSTFHPGEAFYATILSRSGLNVSTETHRFARFPQHGAEHPIDLTIADLPELRSSDSFFARKVRSGLSDDLLTALDSISNDGEPTITEAD